MPSKAVRYVLLIAFFVAAGVALYLATRERDEYPEKAPAEVEAPAMPDTAAADTTLIR